MTRRRFPGLSAIACLWLGLAAADPLYFPPAGAEWATVAPEAAGWDPLELNAALDFAKSRNSSSVVVLLNGHILAEARWDVAGSPRYERMHRGAAAGGHALEDVASVQKSVISFLAGVAEGMKLLDLDAPVDRYLGKGWSKAAPEAEAKITVRHLMSMTSGLTDALEFQQPAGSAWQYNTGAYSRTIPVLEKAVGKDINTITREWLTAPAGMNDTKWVARRGAGAEAANPFGLVTTARDLARFGLVILAGGAWDGNDLLQNPGYLERALSSSQNFNPSYGLLWWLNGQDRVVPGPRGRGRDGSLIPGAPGDLVAAQGALGRKVYVVPSLGLVVTRLGDDPGEAFNNEFWALMMKAAPKE